MVDVIGPQVIDDANQDERLVADCDIRKKT
jgi:hypothetical protein